MYQWLTCLASHDCSVDCGPPRPLTSQAGRTSVVTPTPDEMEEMKSQHSKYSVNRRVPIVIHVHVHKWHLSVYCKALNF